MDKTYTFTVQIDAPRGINGAELRKAIYYAIEHAKDARVPNAEALNRSDMGQVTVL